MMSSRESPLSLASVTPVLSGHIPKYGTRIPNRIFVGGLSGDTSENELKQFFSAYGLVKDCKIILDRGGISKSYGFVTFEHPEDAERIMRKESENLIFKDRKLNIGPAIRKQQPFSRPCEISPSISSLPAYQPANHLQYHSVPNVGNAGIILYCTPDGLVFPAAQATSQSQNVTLPVAMGPQSYNTAIGTTYYGPSQALSPQPSQWAPTTPMRWGVQGPSGTTATLPGSPYVYPIHTAVLPTDVVFATPMAPPMIHPELSHSSTSLIDPGSVEYFHGTPQFANASGLC